MSTPETRILGAHAFAVMVLLPIAGAHAHGSKSLSEEPAHFRDFAAEAEKLEITCDRGQLESGIALPEGFKWIPPPAQVEALRVALGQAADRKQYLKTMYSFAACSSLAYSRLAHRVLDGLGSPVEDDPLWLRLRGAVWTQVRRWSQLLDRGDRE